jgi:hypothetical protein
MVCPKGPVSGLGLYLYPSSVIVIMDQIVGRYWAEVEGAFIVPLR